MMLEILYLFRFSYQIGAMLCNGTMVLD